MTVIPDYERGGVTLYRGDAIEILAELPAASVDVIIADPPYGETALAWDVVLSVWPRLARPLLKPHGSLWCFGSMRHFLEHPESWNGWQHAQELIWEKHNGSGMHVDRFRRVHELFIQFFSTDTTWTEVYKDPVYTDDAVARRIHRKRKPSHWNAVEQSLFEVHEGGPRLMRSVLFCKSMHGQAVHPTQKPVELILPALQYSSAPGAVVLDPFAGSGSTVVACIESGRQCIAIEKDRRHFRTCVSRVEQTFNELISCEMR